MLKGVKYENRKVLSNGQQQIITNQVISLLKKGNVRRYGSNLYSKLNDI